MAEFDNIHYTRHNQPIPSGKTWAQTFQWLNAIFVSASELRVTNADGSVTIITGAGFTQNPDGTPTTVGDVSGIDRQDAGRTDTYESLTFVGGSPLLSDLIDNGLGPWMNEGDDLYSLFRTDLTFNEAPGPGGAGEDTIETNAASFTLAAQYEHLTFIGDGNFAGTGNAQNNELTGKNGNDTLKGLAGNDTLFGGLGNDTMTGGMDDDRYIVDNVGDKVAEAAGAAQGQFDTVLTTLLDYTLTINVERLFFTGTGDFTGTGNASNNFISGGNENDHLIGLGGNDDLDTLDGSTGNDTLEGGLGNDRYGVNDAGDVVIEAAGQGTDSIFTTSAAIDLTSTASLKNVENLYHLGGIAFTGTGNDLNNDIQGGTALDTLSGGLGNDTLDGGSDAHVETLDGGAGNDVYVFLGSVADDITDTSGIDTVKSGLASYTLDDDIENGVIIASAGASLTGNALVNKLTGLSGNDTLKGGGGKDTLIGGLGDDTYLDVDLGVTVTEAAKGGIDTVITAFGGSMLGANIENFQFDPTGGGGLATGNTLANVMKGGLNADTLRGGAGNDTFSGSEILDGMKDRFEGGTGNDTYILIESQNDETVIELAAQGTDTIEVDGMGSVTGLGSLSLNSIAHVENVKVRAYNSSNTFSAEGNALNNRLTGGDQNDFLDGLGGNDTLDGGTGGTDGLRGGTGNDTFIVRHLGVSIDESAANFNSGIDTVEAYVKDYTLGDDVENLTLKGGTTSRMGTGNSLANLITGDLKRDTLDGGGDDGKADTLKGGEGSDTYIVYAGDVIVEVVKPLNDDNEDEVMTALTTYTLGADLENLTFTGLARISHNTVQSCPAPAA